MMMCIAFDHHPDRSRRVTQAHSFARSDAELKPDSFVRSSNEVEELGTESSFPHRRFPAVHTAWRLLLDGAFRWSTF